MERNSAPEDDRDELDRFKRDIDLRTFAMSKGYALDESSSTPRWTVLRHDLDKDKIVVYRHGSGHWRYYSHTPKNRESHGTIIDLIRFRDGKNLGAIRKELRDWTNTPRPRPPELDRTDRHAVRDRAAIVRELAGAAAPGSHPYLEEERGILRETLTHPRFHGTWRLAPGPHRSVLFLHRDEKGGICGAEVKNATYTGFYPGGSKGLWMSKVQPSDRRLVIVEGAIDALSYHQINPHPKTRYVSFAGTLNPHQPGFIESAISWMPAGSTVVAATDKDAAGEAFAKSISEICANHSHVTYERHSPRLGKDWNDHLRARRDCELQQATTQLAAASPASPLRHERDPGIPAETMEYFRRSNTNFERAFGTTRESVQGEIRAHLARHGFTPDRTGRGGPDR